MNDVERVKKEGLEINFQKYLSLASTNFLGLRIKNAFPVHTAIEKDDFLRLKWLGIIHNKIKPGDFMLRLRVPGGIIKAEQLELAAEVAKKFGNRTLDITTRQGLQIRGFNFYYLPRILQDLEAVGLTSFQTGMDNVRNVVSCPLAGIDREELFDASQAVKELTEKIVGNRDYINMPRKLNISITGCKAGCANFAANDVALVPAVKEHEGKQILGFNVYAGGALGSPPPKLSASIDIFVPREDAVMLCLCIAELFCELGSRDKRNRARLKFLLEDIGVEKFRSELENRFGRALERAGEGFELSPHELLGIHAQKQENMSYAGLCVPAGRLSAAQALELSKLAQEYGSGELRFTPTQNVIIPNIPEEKINEFKRESLLEALPLNPSKIMRNLVACTGNDYCDFAQIESKGRALEIARFLESKFPNLDLTLRISGCPSSCGQHQLADIGLQGTKVRISGELVDAVDVFLGGRDTCIGEKVKEKLPWSELPEFLEELLKRYIAERHESESLADFCKRQTVRSLG